MMVRSVKVQVTGQTAPQRAAQLHGRGQLQRQHVHVPLVVIQLPVRSCGHAHRGSDLQAPVAFSGPFMHSTDMHPAQICIMHAHPYIPTRTACPA